MKEIGVKELKNTASRSLEEVEAGERVIVTKRGRPTARSCRWRTPKISFSPTRRNLPRCD